MYDYYDNQEFDNFQKTQAEQEEFERYVSDEAQMRWEYEIDMMALNGINMPISMNYIKKSLKKKKIQRTKNEQRSKKYD